MGKLVIQKPAAFDVNRLRKDLEQCGWVYAQPKLMGLHLRWTGDRLLLAGGDECTGLPHIAAALADRLPGIDVEGEAYIHGEADEVVAGMARRSAHSLHPDHEQVGFWLFDCVSDQDQKTRLAVLDALSQRFGPPVFCVPLRRLRSEEMVYEALSAWLAEGYEGIILRHPLGRWKRGYSAAVQKIKPGGEDLYRVVGTRRAKYGDNALTGLEVEGAGDCRFVVAANPELDRPGLAGKLARVRYTEIGAGGQPLASAAVEILEAVA